MLAHQEKVGTRRNTDKISNWLKCRNKKERDGISKKKKMMKMKMKTKKNNRIQIKKKMKKCPFLILNNYSKIKLKKLIKNGLSLEWSIPKSMMSTINFKSTESFKEGLSFSTVLRIWNWWLRNRKTVKRYSENFMIKKRIKKKELKFKRTTKKNQKRSFHWSNF